MATERLGPIQIDCDAPDYAVVQASFAIGIVTPEDVRWCRLQPEKESWRGIFSWVTGTARNCCSCGQALPQLSRYVFRMDTGEDMFFYLGQCQRCHTVFWSP